MKVSKMYSFAKPPDLKVHHHGIVYYAACYRRRVECADYFVHLHDVSKKKMYHPNLINIGPADVFVPNSATTSSNTIQW